MILALFISTAFATGDFTIGVTIRKGVEPPKGGVVSFAKGKCTTTNGTLTRVREKKVCEAIGERIVRDESSYSVLPWLNPPEVPSFVLRYKGPKSTWEKQTGVVPDTISKPREALRELAVQVLTTAK